MVINLKFYLKAILCFLIGCYIAFSYSAENKPSQWDKFINYQNPESDCPAVYKRDPYLRYEINSYEIQCVPLWISPELTILKPGCFYLIFVGNHKLENIVFSKNCFIQMVKGIDL